MVEDIAQKMTLSALGLRGADGRDCEVTGLSVDSRCVKPGHLFAALPGSLVHGAKFIKYALRMGATAIMTDPAGAALASDVLDGADVALILSDDPRLALARAASRWFGAQHETMVAGKGTNGKTQRTRLSLQVMEPLGQRDGNCRTKEQQS